MAAAMYKAVFRNSKVALIFAVMTIISAVSMVGTSEDSGPLVDAISKANASRAVSGSAAQPPAPPSVFGDYNPNEIVPAPAPEPMPALLDEEADSTMSDPLSTAEGLPAE
jgi:zona occludens toxin (predicted ATPase)